MPDRLGREEIVMIQTLPKKRVSGRAIARPVGD